LINLNNFERKFLFVSFFINDIMNSRVYFIDLKATCAEDALPEKVARLFDAAHFESCFQPGDLSAIKVHFGERGNTGFIPPWLIRPAVDKIKSLKAYPFLTDTNTLYLGSRKNAVKHLNVAISHGFVSEVVGAPILIADGLRGNNYVEKEIPGNRFKKVKIARDIAEADSMLVLSHFKGHVMAGFGGAIKNLAMGCAPAAGKIEQHSARPVADPEKCIGCGLCVSLCPSSSIDLLDGKAVVRAETCIGCGECMSHCQQKAMELDWKAEIPPFIERMVEYALGATIGKKEKMGYINFILNVTPDCDCMGWTDRAIVPDIGILASTDPVALDKACFDLVNMQQGFQNSALQSNHAPELDKFKGLNPDSLSDYQITYGSKIGLGSGIYELIRI
jgi:uncharacterized Fe-S center protein